jgi:hypothetical protein
MPLACTLALAAPPSPSPPAAQPDARAGQELAAQLRALGPVESAQLKGRLKIRDSDGPTRTVPVTCQVIPGEPLWRVIYETGYAEQAAAERLVIVHRVGGPNEYFLARATQPGDSPGEPTRVSGSQLAQPLGGSDFWLLDLGLEFFHWPTQRLLKTEMRKGRVCQVLESVDPHPPPGGYARVVCWVDKESGGPVLAEAYDASRKLMKEFSIRSLKKVDGRWELEEMEIRNVRTRSRTWLEFDFQGH